MIRFMAILLLVQSESLSLGSSLSIDLFFNNQEPSRPIPHNLYSFFSSSNTQRDHTPAIRARASLAFKHNRKFSKPPANALPAWKKASSDQIEQALCFKQQRTVAKDHTVSFAGTMFQISKKSPYRCYANKRIDVHALLDGAVEFFYQKQKIARFDSKTTHAFGLYRTISKPEGLRYGPLTHCLTQLNELSPCPLYLVHSC
jgi:hypothetical protein